MPYGYICENKADYFALVRIQEELMLRMPATPEEEADNDARFAEVDKLLTQWEEKHHVTL